ncbi:MAG: hypothetical protein WC314_04345 [Vulcanimicrobiota bacterium]
MSQKKPRGIAFYVKVMLGLVCALIGLKVFIAVAGALAVGATLFSVAAWGLGILAVGGGLLYLGTKLKSSPKR